VLAACWAHTRRKFYEVAQTEDTPLAHEAVRRIAGLYAIEAPATTSLSIERSIRRGPKTAASDILGDKRLGPAAKESGSRDS
jgi:hypothetical protein